MKHFDHMMELNQDSPVFELLQENTLLFDIETTGLSRIKHQIYMIGLAYREKNQINIQQIFAENIDDEKELLTCFIAECTKHSQLLSFNGITFDLPFIIQRCRKYELLESFDHISHLDLYQECKKIKHLLQLSSYRQKDLEIFLGIDRQDTFDGGSLIPIYQSYTQKPTKEALEFLTLHNYEDILGMISLLPILNYSKIAKHLTLEDVSVESYLTYENEESMELHVKGSFFPSIPTSIHMHDYHFHISMESTRFHAVFPLKKATLRHYVKNYKDYVYLPEEDMIVLSTLASAIPKDRKKKATAKTAYIKREGYFLYLPKQLTASISCPLFKEDDTSDETFIYYEDTTADFSILENILSFYIQNKKQPA